MFRRIAALGAALALGQPAAAECTPDQLDIRGPFGALRFAVEVADDDAERARGLMFRENLPRMAGMLFVYDAPGPVAFWMRNTLMPLDMIFIGADGVVTKVHPDAIPGDLTAIRGGDAVLAVLEIGGGLAARFGIKPGAEIRHSAFTGGEPAWSCG